MLLGLPATYINESVKLANLISMKVAQVTLEIRPPDSHNLGIPPASIWLVYKLVHPIPRSWGEFLKGYLAESLRELQMAFYMGDPRPGEGTCSAGKAIPCKAASLGGNQVLHVIS